MSDEEIYVFEFAFEAEKDADLEPVLTAETKTNHRATMKSIMFSDKTDQTQGLLKSNSTLEKNHVGNS